MIFFALAVASYGYGLMSGMETWLEQTTILWLALAALFLSCRCAAYLPFVGQFFRYPTEITEKDLEGHLAEERKSKKYKFNEDDKSSIASPKSPYSPAPLPQKSSKKKSLRNEDDEADPEVGIPGEVNSEPSSPKLRTRSDSIRGPSGNQGLGDQGVRRSKLGEPTSPKSPYSSKSPMSSKSRPSRRDSA